MNPTDERCAVQQMTARWHEPVTMELDFGQTWAMMSALQLAMRHPGMGEAMRATIRRVTDAMIGTIAPDGLLRELALAGYDPAQDLPADAPPLEREPWEVCP